MFRFVRNRLAVSLLVALTVSLVGFSLLRLSGDLAVSIAGETATQAEIDAVRQSLGLDRPVLVQYFDWLSRALGGDLGTSLYSREPVVQLFLDRVGVTVTLAVSALLLAVLISLPLGVLAATRPNSWLDRLVSMLALAGQALPSFWLALLMVSFFGVTLRWLPISGSATWQAFVMPTVALAVGAMPALMRLTRSGMIEVLDQDFIRTARAKGLLEPTVLYKHALRNALLPLVSLSAVQLGTLLGGSVIIESVFAINGIGLLTYRSILRGDFPVVQSMLIFVSLAYIVLTFLADVFNAWLDPRIRVR